MKRYSYLPVNLQLFAEDEMGVEPGAADLTEAEAPQAEPTPAEKDPSKAFAARLGHERKKMEAEYAPYRDVISKQAQASGMTPEEYLTFVREKQEAEELEDEADRLGKTPDEIKVQRERDDAKARLAQFERKEKLTSEEKTLISDPKLGKFVSDNLEKIRQIAETTDTDLRTGLAIVASERLPELLEAANPEKHIKEYLESLKKGGKPIEIGGGASTPSATTPKTFEDARKAALEMLRNQT